MDEDYDGGFDEQHSADDTEFFDEENLEELREEDEISIEEEGFMNGYREALKKSKIPVEIEE